MIDEKLLKELEIYALKIRIGILEGLKSIGFGHVGGSMSIADVLSVLYGSVMRYDPKNPRWELRDKLVCSKGHAGPAVYAALANKGFFPIEDLKTLNKLDTKLPSHVDMRKTPGIDMTAGSLGQGASAAVGIALGDKLKNNGCQVYLIVGDGEIDEGQVWEAAMFSAAKKIDNITWFVDWNKKQIDGLNKDVLDLGSIHDKFKAFGFDTVTIDGNDISAVYEAVTKPRIPGVPRCIVLDTLKGKGVKAIEEMEDNHSVTKDVEVFDSWLAPLREELAAMESGEAS